MHLKLNSKTKIILILRTFRMVWDYGKYVLSKDFDLIQVQDSIKISLQVNHSESFMVYIYIIIEKNYILAIVQKKINTYLCLKNLERGYINQDPEIDDIQRTDLHKKNTIHHIVISMELAIYHSFMENIKWGQGIFNQ